MQTLKTIGSGVLGLIIGWLLVWAHMSDLVEVCESKAVSLQAELHEAEQAREVVAERLVKTEQERSQAYTWLAEQAGAKVDLSIPFKTLKIELSSLANNCEAGQTWSMQTSQGCQRKVQIETNEIAGLAKMMSKAENVWKLATRGR